MENSNNNKNSSFEYFDAYNLLYKKPHQTRLHHKLKPEKIYDNLQSYNLNDKQIDTLIDEVKEWKISNEKVVAAELIGIVSIILSILVAIKTVPEWCAWIVVVGLTIVISITVLYDSSRYSVALAALQAYKRFLLKDSNNKN